MDTNQAIGDATTSPTAAEDLLIASRRTAAAVPTEPDKVIAPRVALALSGGGIRSATFCFGLLRALAKAGTLPHVDYLSTVSGGGYVGAAFARLFRDGRKPQDVYAGLARDDSVLLWWLRNNGRYLTPAGMRDVLQAFASLFRGTLSTHFEVGMLMVLAACAMLALPVALLWLPGTHAAGESWTEIVRTHHLSVWWWAAALPLFLVGREIFAYWFSRSNDDVESGRVDVAVTLIATIVAFAVGWKLISSLPASSVWTCLATVLAYPLLWTPAAALAVRGRERKAKLELGPARLRHTKALGKWLAGFLLVAIVGLIDIVSYELVRWFGQAALRIGFPGAAAFVAVGHWIMSHWKTGRENVKAVMSRLGTSQTINIVGLVFLAIVALVWTMFVQWLVLPSTAWPFAPDLSDRLASLLHLVVVSAAAVLYVWSTRNGLETLNLSSLHNFYRARLERAYVSTGNDERFDTKILEPKEAVVGIEDRMRITEAMHGDDIALAEHRPHTAGGPIHLVNCCVNQTVDDRTDLYNADRKGVALTVSSLGVETGTHMPDGTPPPGTLSQWIAVSGAAASSGMGSQTTPGAAALLFLSGLRLGYWQPSMLGQRPDSKVRKMRRFQMLKAECLARFPGLRSPQWYVSDGGHFENTAVYALLKREVELIVVADCGADPKYEFDDVENLVRKAAIDYAARIEFVLPKAWQGNLEEDPDAELRRAVGLPRGSGDEAIGKREGDRWLLLGRIRYNGGARGTLVIVKPRVVPGLPLDAASYASRNGVFPQQTTGDQFFDEAQWESYHELGVRLGSILTPGRLRQLREWAGDSQGKTPNG